MAVNRRYSKGESKSFLGRSCTKWLAALNGYSAKLKGSALARIAASPEVDYITDDGIASIFVGAPSVGPALIDAFGKRAPTATNGTDGVGIDVYGIGKFLILINNEI